MDESQGKCVCVRVCVYGGRGGWDVQGFEDWYLLHSYTFLLYIFP